MTGLKVPTTAGARTLVVHYLDPVTGFRLEKRESYGHQSIRLLDDGVTWLDDEGYAFVPYHRVLMVRDEPDEARTPLEPSAQSK